MFESTILIFHKISKHRELDFSSGPVGSYENRNSASLLVKYFVTDF